MASTILTRHKKRVIQIQKRLAEVADIHQEGRRDFKRTKQQLTDLTEELPFRRIRLRRNRK
jgi:hypothetical protein